MNCKTVGLPEPKFKLQNDTKQEILVVLTLVQLFLTRIQSIIYDIEIESTKHKKAR